MALPDWLFYSLAALLAAVLVVFSLRYWPGKAHEAGPFDGSPRDGLTISGRQLGLIQAGPGLSAQLVEIDDGTFLHTLAGQRPDEGVRSAGVFLVLPSRFGVFYAGKKIVASMELRSTGRDASPQAFIGYYTIGRPGGNSPHTPCSLSVHWQTCTMHYRPPPAGKGKVVDYFGLWPDPQGLSRSVDIRAVRIRLDDGSEQAPPPAPDQRQ